MVDENNFKKLSVVIVLGILGILTVLIILPILTAIITGLILAYIFYPAYQKIQASITNKSLSAFVVILLVLLLICVPLWFLLPLLVKQIFDVYLFLQKIDVLEVFSNIFPSLSQTDFSKDFAISFNTFISNIAKSILSGTSSIFLNLPSLALKTVVVFFVFFFGMRDADLFSKYVASLSPFSKSTEKDLAKRFKDITSSVIYGYVVVGVLQGLLTGLGLFVFGMPQALVLTIFAILASIIPVLGSWVVYVPAATYLLISGHIFSGIALLLYGALFVSWIDNIIRPYIISRRTKISTVIVLIGMIGGLIVFGILGLIIGPLILSYLILILDAYRKNKFPSLFSQ